MSSGTLRRDDFALDDDGYVVAELVGIDPSNVLLFHNGGTYRLVPESSPPGQASKESPVRTISLFPEHEPDVAASYIDLPPDRAVETLSALAVTAGGRVLRFRVIIKTDVGQYDSGRYLPITEAIAWIETLWANVDLSKAAAGPPGPVVYDFDTGITDTTIGFGPSLSVHFDFAAVLRAGVPVARAEAVIARIYALFSTGEDDT